MPEFSGLSCRSKRIQVDGQTKEKRTTISFTFQTHLKDGRERIDSFVEEALETYKERMSEKKDLSR